MSDPRGRLEKSALQAIDMKGIGLASAAMAITRSKEAFDAVKTQVSELGELESAASRSQAESATAAVALGNRVVATFGAVGIVLAALVTWQCVRLIDEPLSQAVAIARGVAAGNLDVQVGDAGRDSTGQVLKALGQVVVRLTEAIQRIRGAADEMGVASREIAQGNQDLSTRTERTAASLQETAGEARGLASQALERAREGGEAVGGAVRTMDAINDRPSASAKSSA